MALSPYFPMELLLAHIIIMLPLSGHMESMNTWKTVTGVSCSQSVNSATRLRHVLTKIMIKSLRLREAQSILLYRDRLTEVVSNRTIMLYSDGIFSRERIAHVAIVLESNSINVPETCTLIAYFKYYWCRK